jgi:hypothetical protein
MLKPHFLSPKTTILPCIKITACTKKQFAKLLIVYNSFCIISHQKTHHTILAQKIQTQNNPSKSHFVTKKAQCNNNLYPKYANATLIQKRIIQDGSYTLEAKIRLVPHDKK